MIWFTSDTHFCHKLMLQYRPFHTIDDMNEFIIDKWNKKIGKHDIVYVLGDFGFGNREELKKILTALNGRKTLIRGNHDKRARVHSIKGWVNVKDYHELIYKKSTRICLFHFPISDWNRRWKGSLHIHGHSHGKHNGDGRMMDVGVDALNYSPISIEDVYDRLINRPITSYVERNLEQ